MLKFLKSFQSEVAGSPFRRAAIESIVVGFSSQAILLVTAILSARLLGVEGRGHLALLIVFPTILVSLGELGLPGAIVYFLSKDRRHSCWIVSLAAHLFSAQAVVLVALHGIILFFYLADQPVSVQWAGYVSLLGIPAILALDYPMAVLQGFGRFNSLNAMRLIPLLLYSLWLVCIYFVGEVNLSLIVLGWALANFIVGICGIVVINRDLANFTSDDSGRPSYREVLSFGLRGLLGTATPFDILCLDQLIAGLFIGPSALGLYVVGRAFSSVPNIIASSACFVVLPFVARESDKATARRLTWKAVVAATALNMMICSALVLLMPYLVPLFFGSEFSDSVLMAQVLICGGVCLAARRILVEGFRGMGMPQLSSYAELALLPWLFLTVPLLMWKAGITGLSFAVASGYGVTLVFAVFLSVQMCDVKRN